MTWDPRRINRAVLGGMLVGGFVGLVFLKGLGFEGVSGELLAIIGTPVGTVIAYFFTKDKDE